MEKTLVLLKPDAVQRALVGEIISRIESKGLKVAGMKLILVNNELARKHYSEHVDKPFYAGLEKCITSSPLVAMVIQGESAISVVRELMGPTDPKSAAPGTIRGDYGMSIGLNLVHGSDQPESAIKEISLFFKDDEIVEYERASEPWITES